MPAVFTRHPDSRVAVPARAGSCRHTALALPPEPIVPKDAVDRRGPSREREVARGHLRRHHPDQIVLPDDAIEQVGDRVLRAVRTFQMHVPHVHEEHEQARVGAGGHGSRFGNGVGFDHAPLCDTGGTRADDLEAFDLLRHAVFEHLEVLRVEIGDRRAVLRDVRVDPNEIGARAKARLLLVGGSWAAGANDVREMIATATVHPCNAEPRGQRTSWRLHRRLAGGLRHCSAKRANDPANGENDRQHDQRP